MAAPSSRSVVRSTSTQLLSCAKALVDLINAANQDLVVDLQGIDLMDSSGLGVLVGALKRVRARAVHWSWSALMSASSCAPDHRTEHRVQGLPHDRRPSPLIGRRTVGPAASRVQANLSVGMAC